MLLLPIIIYFLDLWTDIVSPNFYAAFAWSLLDSIADTEQNPPRLRPLREISCIIVMEDEMVTEHWPFKYQLLCNAYDARTHVLSRLC